MSIDFPTWVVFDSDAIPRLSVLSPPVGRVVLVLASADAMAAGWGSGLAVALARGWSGQGHRVVLADLGLTRPTLDALLKEPNGEGLTDALMFGASPARVARPVDVDGQAMFVVPAGTVVADAVAALDSPRWSRLCAGFRDAGVLFAVFAPEGEPVRNGALAEATEVVVLAVEGEDLTALLQDVTVPVRGVFGLSGIGVVEEVAGSAPAELVPEEEAAEWDGDLEPFVQDLPEEGAPEEEALEEVAAHEVPEGVAPEVELTPDRVGDEGPADVGADAGPEAEARMIPLPADETEEIEDGADVVAMGEARVGTPDLPAGKARGAGRRVMMLLLVLLVIVAGALAAAWFGYVEIPGVTPTHPPAESIEVLPTPSTAPPQPTSLAAAYSVAVGAFQDSITAAAAAQRLAATATGVLVITVPVRVEGAVVHRVLLGPAVDSAAARDLVARLARETGANVGSWLIRPTPSAFQLGEVDAFEAAQRRAAVLRGLSISAYVLAVDFSNGATRYRVYAGAFADEPEASYMKERLAAQGLSDTTLSNRIGRLPE